MPYLPTNYYPKNRGIVVNNSNEPIAFYCLIDSYDIINRAIIRIYNYLTNELTGVIYLNEQGKIFKSHEISDEDYKKWYNNEYDDNDQDKRPWNDNINENPLPIKGGYGENSILYVEIPSNTITISENKKYLWDIEVFNDIENVWIVDGEVIETYNSSSQIKIYPNDNIQINNIFSTDIGDFLISSIRNKSWTYEGTAAISETSGQINENDYTVYKHSIILNNSNSLILPDDDTDLIIQLNIYNYRLYKDDVPDVFIIDNDLDGWVVLEKESENGLYKGYIYSKTLFTETETYKTYSYIYRRYQTINIEKNNQIHIPNGSVYTIYSNSIKSTSNYFTTLNEPIINFYTYKEKEEIKIEDSTIVLNNSYHQFWGEVDENNGYPLAWYQCTVFDNGIEKYQTEKYYSSNIYFSYNEFLNKYYTLKFKLVYQNGYVQEKDINIIIEHNDKSSVNIVPFVDYNRKAIGINYNNVNNFTPSIHGQYEYINDVGIKINSGYLDYNTNEGVSKIINAKSEWEVHGIFESDVHDDIFEINIDNIIYSLKYDAENDKFLWCGSEIEYDLFNEGTQPYLFTADENNLINDKLKTIIGDNYNQNITGFNYNDFLNNKNFIIKCEYNENNQLLEIKLFFNNETIIMQEFTLDSINRIISVKLYNNIIWTKIMIYDNPIDENKIYKTENIQLFVNLENGEINGGDFFVPNGYVLYGYNIFRQNLLNEKEFKNYSFISTILIKDQQRKIVGLYDYGIGGDNKYKYFIIPIYKDNNKDFYIAGTIIESIEVKTDWFETSIFGTISNNNDYYLIDEKQKWYFLLDTKADNLTFNTDSQVHNLNTALPKVAKSNKNYLTSSITTKLGNLRNDCEYVNDSIKYLHEFSQFANSNKIKILRLPNGLIIPVDITLINSSNNNILINPPTDISFNWTQVGKYDNNSLYEYLYMEKEDE